MRKRYCWTATIGEFPKKSIVNSSFYNCVAPNKEAALKVFRRYAQKHFLDPSSVEIYSEVGSAGVNAAKELIN